MEKQCTWKYTPGQRIRWLVKKLFQQLKTAQGKFRFKLPEHSNLDDTSPVDNSTIPVVTWTKEPLEILRKAVVEVRFEDHRATLPLQVANKHGNSLLGRSWFKALGVHIHGTQKVSVGSEVVERFPCVYTERWGAFMQDTVHIDQK